MLPTGLQSLSASQNAVPADAISSSNSISNSINTTHADVTASNTVTPKTGSNAAGATGSVKLDMLSLLDALPGRSFRARSTDSGNGETSGNVNSMWATKSS